MTSSRVAQVSRVIANPYERSPEQTDFVPLRRQDFPAFYRQFLSPRPEPLFIDIYDPLPFPTLKQFVAYFSKDKFWVQGDLSSPTAYFALHDFQDEHDLANLDFFFFDGYPEPGSKQAHDLQACVEGRIAKFGLTRIQTFVLASSTGKIKLLESFGFRKEGVLREHYFYNSRLHDVVVHAWMAEGRRD